MKFIFALLFFIIIFRLVFSMGTRFLVHRIRKSANMGEPSQDQAAYKPSKKKKIAKDKGDYVDFEEIE